MEFVLIGLLCLFVLVAGGFIGLWLGHKFNELEAKARAEDLTYKDKWMAAVKLLGEEGRLTPEQIEQITGPKHQPVKELNDELLLYPDQKQFRSMSSWDRRDLEVQRARQGLPPADDLKGMSSWDRKDVLKARMKFADRRK
jgi:hypothetical protein